MRGSFCRLYTRGWCFRTEWR